mgnify:CR=1 FL=1
METKALKTLEFDKILKRLSDFAVMESTKDEIMRIMPAKPLKSAQKMQDETKEASRILTKCGSLPITCANDVTASLKRADMGGTLTMSELLNIAKVLETARRIKMHTKDAECEILAEHIDALYEDKRLETDITGAVIDAETMADDASSTLLDIRRKIRAANNKVKDILQKIITSPSHQKHLQEQLITLRGDRYVIPLKSEYKGAIPGVVHDVSATGSTIFLEPMSVVETNNEIRRLLGEEKDEIEKILANLTNEVALVSKLIKMSYDTISCIDLIFAKGKYALATDAFAPNINDKGHINLRRARHPLIDPKKVVATDIYLGKNFDTLVITGPNTGGKTVTLKTIGLLTVMALSGLHITAEEGSEIAVFEDVFADIGDEQSIEQSLSTFSGHMKRISGILDLAGHATLTLLDELGAGTDPAEGAALAVSILEQLRRQGSLLMATTHYAELKVYALETPGVVNASCEFNVETLMPTYKLSVGVPGKSNAFLISAKLGIPQEIIDAARNHMSNDDKRLDSVLSQLDDLKVQLKDAQAEAEQARYEAEHALESAEKKRDDLIKKGEEELENARRQAHDLMQQVQNEAYSLTDELRRIQKDEKTSAAQRAVRAREIARRDTETLLKKTDAKPQPVKEFVPLKEVQIGQEVVIADLGQTATVTARPDRNGMVEVRAGIMKTKVPLTNLRAPDKMEKRKPAEPRRSTRVQLDKSRKTSMELNLLGYTVDEALNEVDKFLDSGMLRGQSTLYIIHGNGTGALRNAIQKHLRTHRGVKSFRLGRYGEGESGVTVVELK